MGFWGIDENPTEQRTKHSKMPSLETLHKGECSVCPLGPNGRSPAFYHTLKHPHMEPHGTERPMVYMLGEAPGKDEDRVGRPFVGKAGNALRIRIPDDQSGDDYLRWNNTVRCHPLENRTPEYMEVECCRPSVQKDIERTKPFAIFGFGNVPLKWVCGETGITAWTGRWMPVKVGSHTCWYFPITHPSAILRTRRFDPRDENDWGSDAEFGFILDVERAFEMVEDFYEEDYQPIVHSPEEALANIEIVTGDKDGDVERIDDMLEHCWSKKHVGFDWETKGTRPYADDAKILSLALDSGSRTMSFALDHREAGWSAKSRAKVDTLLKEFIYHAECRKLVHALSFEQEWTAMFYGKKALRSGKWGCSLMQAYTLDERRGAMSLEFLCQQYFGINIKELSNVNRKDLDSEPLEKVLRYNGGDARYHRHLYLEQHYRLLDDGTMEFYEHMLRRVPTMVLTQMKGIPVHQPTVIKLYDEWMDKRSAVEEKLARMKAVKAFKDKYRTPFRPSATKEVKTIFKDLGVNLDSVDEPELEKINHPQSAVVLAAEILNWREANKILSTYVLPVLDVQAHRFDKQELEVLAEAEAGSALHPDGMMHPLTTLHQTRTSRSASEETNYQNWPKREHKEIRTIVDARAYKEPGAPKRIRKWKVVSFDYGQIQARNVAMESLDKELIKAFWDRYDIHHDWTERIAAEYPKWMDEKGGVEFVKSTKGFTKDQGEDLWKWHRDVTKNKFVFPSFFGAQPPKLAGYLDIPENVMARLQKKFWIKFPSIKGWQDRLIDDFYRYGYTTSLAGHRRHAPASTNEIINAPIQADEARIVCDAMARLSELGKDEFQANMEIHDDLSFLWPAEHVEEYAIVVIDYMVNVPYKWANVVPIVVEMSVGDNWGFKDPVGDYASDTWKRSLGIDDGKRRKLGILH